MVYGGLVGNPRPLMPRFELAAREAAAAGARSAIWGGARSMELLAAHRASIDAPCTLCTLCKVFREERVGRSGKFFFFFFRPKEKKKFGRGRGTLGGTKGCKPCKACKARACRFSAQLTCTHPHTPQPPIRPAPTRALCTAHRFPPRPGHAHRSNCSRSGPALAAQLRLQLTSTPPAPTAAPVRAALVAVAGFCTCLTPAARTSGRSRRELRHPVHAARPAVHHHVQPPRSCPAIAPSTLAGRR